MQVKCALNSEGNHPAPNSFTRMESHKVAQTLGYETQHEVPAAQRRHTLDCDQVALIPKPNEHLRAATQSCRTRATLGATSELLQA